MSPCPSVSLVKLQELAKSAEKVLVLSQCRCGQLVGTSSEPHADGTLPLSGVPLQTLRVVLGMAGAQQPSHQAIAYQAELVPSFADLMGIWIWHTQTLVLALQASSSMAEAAPRPSQSLRSASAAWRERGPDLVSILASFQLDGLGQACRLGYGDMVSPSAQG